MLKRRTILALLTYRRLIEVAKQTGISGVARKTKPEMVRVIAGKRTVKTAEILELLTLQELKTLSRTA